jgi:general secretion pathway protein E
VDTESSCLLRGGTFSASAEGKKILCQLSDGRLLIAEGQHLNPHVLSYRARLGKMKRPYRPIFTHIDTIGQIYQSGGADGTGRNLDHTAMQVTPRIC